MNAQHHREVANDFVQPDKIENYVDTQVTKDIGDAIESLEYEINTLILPMDKRHSLLWDLV